MMLRVGFQRRGRTAGCLAASIEVSGALRYWRSGCERASNDLVVDLLAEDD